MKKIYVLLLSPLFLVSAFGQNVGIGTNAPTYKLDVVGDVNVNAGNGYRVNGSAGAGQYLRGDGTRFTPNTIQPTDVPSGSGYYIWNGTALQTGDFRISGNGSLGTMSIGSVTPNSSAILDIASGNKGVSFPNIDLQSSNDANTIASPKKGLVVYNTGVTLSPSGLYINVGTPALPNWQKLSDASGTVGSVSAVAPLQNTGTASNAVIELTGTVPISKGGTGLGLGAVANGQILVGNGTGFTTNVIGGTTNQIGVNNGTGSITLTTPQDIATTSNVAFNKVTLNTATDINSLEAGRSIKIGGTSQSAAAAGAGALRYNSGNIEYSDGTNWKTANTNASGDFIKNQTSQQNPADFNISGSGKAANGYTWGSGKGALSTDQGSSIEIGGSGQPYIDFDNSTGDFDARIQLTGDDELLFDGTNVGIGNAPGTTRLFLKGDGTNPIFSAVDNTNVVKVYIDPAGKVGINTSSPNTSLDVRTTEAIQFPSGSTLQRPSAPQAGFTRYNSDNKAIEYYDGAQWVSANQTQVAIGTITPYGGITAPNGWLICNGAAVSRTTYSELFAAIGITYGSGDGSTTFNLPDLQGKTAFGLGAAPFNILGSSGGGTSVTPTLNSSALTVDIAATTTTLPNHVHTVPAHSHGFSLATGATNTGSEGAHTHNWGGHWSIDDSNSFLNDNGDGANGNTLSDNIFWWGHPTYPATNYYDLPGAAISAGSHTHTATHDITVPYDNDSDGGISNAGMSYESTDGTKNGNNPTEGGVTIAAAGAHTHAVRMYSHKHWIKQRATTAGSAHLHSIPVLTVTGTVGTAGTSGDAIFNSGNPTTNPTISIDPSPASVTGTITSSAVSTTNPYQVVNYIIKATNTSTASIVAVNIGSGSLGQTLYNNGTAWTPTSNLYNAGNYIGIGTTNPTAGLLHIVENSSSATQTGLTIDESDIGNALAINESGNGTALLINGNDAGAAINATVSGAVTNTATGYILADNRTSSSTVNKTGLSVSSTGSWTGSGTTNTGIAVDVSGGLTNYAAVLTGGNVGIGTAAPAALFSVGSGSNFQVNSSGAIAAATGITSSGSITFSGLNTSGLVKTATTSGLLSIGQAGSADIANLAITDAKVNDVAWGKVTGKPTTLSGFGVTDGVQLQGSSPGSAQTGNYNISGTGIVATRLGVGATTSPGFALDVVGRSRFRTGGGTAGFWLSNAANTADNAFIGMVDDNNVGLFGAGGASWGLSMNVNNAAITASGLITASNINQAPILSTKSNASRFTTTALATWYYTGESITITVPSGPNRKYRIHMRQMGINSATSNAGGGMILFLSNSSSSVATGPTGLGTPYVSIPAGAWQSFSCEGYLDLAPGTYTYYVWVYAIANNVTLANATGDSWSYCTVMAYPM